MELLSEGIKTDAKDMQIVHTLSAQKVQSWAFGDELVRTIQIENTPFFVAKDVSIALGYKNSTDLTRSLDSDEIINCFPYKIRVFKIGHVLVQDNNWQLFDEKWCKCQPLS